VAVVADVSDSIRWDTAVETALGEFRRIDIPVNAAGIARHSASEETSDDDWRRIIDVNLDGTYFCCRAVGRHRLEVTQRYVTLLDADLRAAHKRFSPGDDLARLGGFARRDRPVSCPGEGP
jgi:NAD(P)-dependent dehydrogenase (short-subunit alcohol dehydrogenase family)